LRRHCRGRAAARPTARIAQDLRDLGISAPTREVRACLADLVTAGWPVGSSSAKPAGAYLAERRDDSKAGYLTLVRRFRAQARRARKFRETARAALSGQAVFNFDEAENAFHELQAAPLLAAGADGVCRNG